MCSAVLAGSLVVGAAQAQQNQPNPSQPGPGTQKNLQPQPNNPQGAAAQVQGTGTQIRGQVVRSGDGQFVVRGSDNKEWTFRTNPQTRYWHNQKEGRFDDIRAGATINAWYGPPQGADYYANTVQVLPADGASTTQTSPPASNTVYEGQVVRVIGNDQVVIRTSDNKEVTVYVTPQTTYRLEDQPATFQQFQPGVPIRVNYYMQGDRPHARGIIGRRVR